MNISTQSIFDIGSKRPTASTGLEYFRGWHVASYPVWSRDSEAVLRVDAARFQEVRSIVLKIKTFHPDTTPPKVLRIYSDGHEMLEIPVSSTGMQSILVETPVIQPDAAYGFIRFELSEIASPSKLGLSKDDRLLGFHIYSVIENVVPVVFPVDMTVPALGETVLASGWDRIEPGYGVWSIASNAQLVFPGYLDLSDVQALSFEVDTLPRPEDHAALQVELWNKNRLLETWKFGGNTRGIRTCPLDSVNAGEELEITFRISELASPQALGINADSRPLGILLKSVDIIS